mgnify:CR=1 FL=1
MTEQQYMQLMAQQRGGQQRQPSPEQQAMMMQQQQMQEGPGAAGGFMGGLLDSALIGLLPNSSYQNPNDPANVGASKMGGLIGMILPMLLAKYGAGKVLSSLASKEGMLANWMGKTAQGVERTTQQAGRADMLASVLGGGIGGGLAEGPMGGLLGAAGLAAHSKFMGAGKAMGDKETYAIGELFGGGKVKPLKTKEQLIKEAKINKSKTNLTAEESKIYSEKIRNVYDPKTKTINLTDVVDDAKAGFDDIQYGKVGPDDYISAREVIEGYKRDPLQKITVERAVANKVQLPDKTWDKTPKYLAPTEKSYQEMYDELQQILLTDKKVYTLKDGKKKTVSFMEDWYINNKKGVKEKVKGTNSLTPITTIENRLKVAGKFPGFQPTAKKIGTRKPGTDTVIAGKGEQPVSNEDVVSNLQSQGIDIQLQP